MKWLTSSGFWHLRCYEKCNGGPRKRHKKTMAVPRCEGELVLSSPALRHDGFRGQSSLTTHPRFDSARDHRRRIRFRWSGLLRDSKIWVKRDCCAGPFRNPLQFAVAIDFRYELHRCASAS